MAPTPTSKSATAIKEKKEKKEKLFHPSSRKAGQLARNALRKGKLGNLASKRTHKQNSLGMRCISIYLSDERFIDFLD
jgi:translation machinery-associated protein 16